MNNSRPTSLSDSGVKISSTEDAIIPSITCSSFETDENGMARSLSKKERYFSEKQEKNIFKKILHPSYHERSQGFKKLFVDKGLVDDIDVFLASYSCAYQREILAQGRMYISQSNVCFYANIIGWETSLVIPMKDIKTITKQKAAYIFPNSIQIEKHNGDKYFFASFVNRDKSIQILSTALDRENEGQPITPQEVWEMLNNSEDKNSPSVNQPLDSFNSISSPTGTSSNMTVLNGRKSKKMHSSKQDKSDKDNISQGSSSHGSSDLVEEEAHFIDENLNMFGDGDSSTNTNFEEIRCPCEEHPGRLFLDAVFPIPVAKLHELMFTDNPWFDELNATLKNRDYASSSWVVDKSGAESRNVTYGVALNHAMAPKNVIVNEKQTISYFPKKEDGIIVFKETQNSGVPYADHFVVQCTYCISRAGPSECRMKVHGGIHYKKGVWGIVKGYIEKGTNQGLDDHFRLLEKMLKDECARINRSEPQSQGSFEPAASPIQQKINHEITSEIRDRKSRLTAGSDELVRSRRGIERSENDHSTLKDVSSLRGSMEEIRVLLIALCVIVAILLVVIASILWQIRDFIRPQEVSVSTPDKDTTEMLRVLMLQIEQLKSQVDIISQNVQK